MTNSEFYTALRTIDRLLGYQSSWLIPEMTADERIQMRNVWDDLAEQLLTIAEKYPSQAAQITCLRDRYSVGGTTPQFFKWSYYNASSSLYVEDKLVLSCSPLPQIYEYILTH